MTAYSATNPSPRYRELLAVYRQVHEQGLPDQNIPADEMFAGQSLRAHVEPLKLLMQLIGAKSLLDYGAGKGFLYRQKPFLAAHGVEAASLQEYWGLETLVLYDPAVPAYDTLSEDLRCDVVISTDVLEHCPTDDIDWMLRDMMSRANRLFYANIASYPAKKQLPNGENAHCTVQSPAWWETKLKKAAEGLPLSYVVVVTERDTGPRTLWKRLFGKKTKTTTISNHPELAKALKAA